MGKHQLEPAKLGKIGNLKNLKAFKNIGKIFGWKKNHPLVEKTIKNMMKVIFEQKGEP